MRGIHTESKQEHYDVIIIGAGIAGLSTAALLAKAGKSVLIIERHDRVGGYAHGFKRRAYHFDSGVHLVSGCSAEGYENGSTIYKICQTVGIDSEALFIPTPNYGSVNFPDFSLTLHAGEDAFVHSFPEEQDNVRRLMRLCKTIAEQAMIADEVIALSRVTRVSPMQQLADLFRYRRSTLAEVLDEYLISPDIKSACAGLWPYLGLPPTQLSFLYWATMMAGYVYEGGYYCRGSFQHYANQLSSAIERLSGEVLLNASVRRILVNDGNVQGVMLENGQRIMAETVVSNVDAKQTHELLIGSEHLPNGTIERLQNLTPSLSIFACYIATDLAIDKTQHTHESFYYDSVDFDLTYQQTLAGTPNWFSITLPTLSDATLAPNGEHIMLLTTLCPFDVGQSWRQAKAVFQERLLNQAEQQFPNLKQHIQWLESGTPRTLERYTLNAQGAAYGFAPTPDQIGVNRPDVKGVLSGLYHAGHWTRPGGGVAGVSISAQLAAQAILNIPKQKDFWQSLGKMVL